MNCDKTGADQPAFHYWQLMIPMTCNLISDPQNSTRCYKVHHLSMQFWTKTFMYQRIYWKFLQTGIPFNINS